MTIEHAEPPDIDLHLKEILMASIGIQPTMATPHVQPKISPELAKARAELYYALDEHLPIDSPHQNHDLKKTVRYWFNEVQRLTKVERFKGNINTPFSEAQGDQLDDPLSLVEMTIHAHYPEALNLFLGIKGYGGVEPLTPLGDSLLSQAATQGNENILKMVHDFSHIRGVTVHHFCHSSMLADAIGFSPYPILHHGRLSDPQLQRRLIGWWDGTQSDFSPSEPIIVDYDGAIPTVNFLLRHGANPRIPSAQQISPLEFVTHPSPDDIRNFFNLEEDENVNEKIKFLRIEADGAFLFQMKIEGQGLPQRELSIHVRYNFKQLALILAKAALDPNNQGGLKEKADYDALIQRRVQEKVNKALHNAHVTAYHAMNSAVNDVKLQADAARHDAFDAKEHADKVGVFALNVADSAQEAIEAHHAALLREAKLRGIAIHPIRRAFVYNISLCVQSLWECAKDQGNPTGAKTTRAKTKMDHVAGGD
jgi:hypothetical protein